MILIRNSSIGGLRRTLCKALGRAPMLATGGCGPSVNCCGCGFLLLLRRIPSSDIIFPRLVLTRGDRCDTLGSVCYNSGFLFASAKGHRVQIEGDSVVVRGGSPPSKLHRVLLLLLWRLLLVYRPTTTRPMLDVTMVVLQDAADLRSNVAMVRLGQTRRNVRGWRNLEKTTRRWITPGLIVYQP